MWPEFNVQGAVQHLLIWYFRHSSLGLGEVLLLAGEKIGCVPGHTHNFGAFP